MVHLTPPGLAASGAYRRWAAGLPGQCILAGAEACPRRPGTGLGFHASARTLAKLHAVSPRLFPLPAYCQPRCPAPDSPSAKASRKEVNGSSASVSEAAERPSLVDEAAERCQPTGSAEAGLETRVPEPRTARLLLRLEGSVGRGATVSDAACPADLDAGA